MQRKTLTPAVAVAVVAVAAVVVAVAVAAEVAVTDMVCYNKSRILMQFHITGKCNLRCKHCYRVEGDVEPLSFDDVINIIEQFKDLRKKFNSFYGTGRKGHINITGGEPFFRKDIKDILKYLGDNREYFTYAILSNGSFIDDEMTEILKSTNVAFVQLSIDGDSQMHDSLRKKGDYDRVMQTAGYLEKKGIRTYISFTANKQNIQYLPLVAKECRKRKITKLWSDRLVPIGNGEDIKSLAITKDEMSTYISLMKKARGNIFVRRFNKKTLLSMNRALQFQNSGGSIYSCSAGDTLITVDEFGNIMPCRRMPIICGNALRTTLSDVYFNNDIFKKLRVKFIPDECTHCAYNYYCRGGAKCQSYAAYGSFYKADPGCALVRESE